MVTCRPVSELGGPIAVDSETMGLSPLRDRLCLCSCRPATAGVHLVQFHGRNYHAPRPPPAAGRPGLPEDLPFRAVRPCCPAVFPGCRLRPDLCTKIASRLVRTYTDRHGLKDLIREMLGIELDKPSRARTGVPTNLAMRSCATRPATCFTCMR